MHPVSDLYDERKKWKNWLPGLILVFIALAIVGMAQILSFKVPPKVASKVASFTTESIFVTEINQYLDANGLDADDVISIIQVPNGSLQVFY